MQTTNLILCQLEDDSWYLEQTIKINGRKKKTTEVIKEKSRIAMIKRIIQEVRKYNHEKLFTIGTPATEVLILTGFRYKQL